MRKVIHTVSAPETGSRLDTFIAEKGTLTRSFIQKLIRQGMITVNSRKEKPGYRTKTDDIIEVTVPDRPEAVLIPEAIPVEVLWEDEHIIVVNKPPDIVMYPAVGNRSGTLMNAVISICPKLSPVGGPLRPGVVHRLDKDTSGVIIIAKDEQAHHELVRQFRQREVEKHYMALLYGNMKADRGEIKAPIGRSDSDRKKMSTRSLRGKEAVTHFEVIERYGAATLARVRIITGRTHQIRVHLASLGHPVLGDRTYGKKTEVRAGQKIIKFPRQMLHAYSLRIKHPLSGEALEFRSPIPGDMDRALKTLRGDS